MQNRQTMSIDESLCVGCGACARACPTDAIILSFGKAEVDLTRCADCELCLQVCPTQAIRLIPEGVHEIGLRIQNLRRKVEILSKLVERTVSTRRKT